jgi:hypothetical protein
MVATTNSAPGDTRRFLIERWLSRRGLPQLIEGYGSERSIDIRTLRWVLLWAAVEIVLLCASAPAADELRLVAAAAGLLLLLAYVVLYGRVTGRSLWRPQEALRWYDVVATALVPGLVAGLRFGHIGGFVDGFLFHLQGVLVIYAFVGFGLIWILGWSVGWLLSQLPHLVVLAARTLPIVLLLVIFLLFASELWQAAASASLSEVVAIVVIAALIAVGFIASRVVSDVAELTPARRPIPADALEGTPAEGLPGDPREAERPSLGRLQRSNLGALLLVSQMLQVQLVALIVVGFLVVVGLIVAPTHVQTQWVAGEVQPLAAFDFLGEPRMLSWELLVVAIVLGAFAGVYFAGYALGDERYREDALGRTIADLRKSVAVRDAYATWLQSPAPETASMSAETAGAVSQSVAFLAARPDPAHVDLADRAARSD